MKKYFLGIVLILSLILAPNVYAFEIGVSSTEEHLSGIYLTGEDKKLFVIPPHQKNAIAILYGDFQGDNADLGKIEVNITGINGMNLTTLSSELSESDTITGTNGNYTITVNNASDNYDGTGLFILTMPNVPASTKYNVSVTAKAYNKNNSLISTKNVTIEYVVAVKVTNCDDNSNFNISTSAGITEKISDFFDENYSITTNNDIIDITVTPESSKTNIYYNQNCDFETITKQNSIKGFKLNYGIENTTCFFVETECSRKWSEDPANNLDDYSVIGENDWYESLQYTPTFISLNVTRKDNRSKINTLKSLSISDVTINFNPNLKTYTATVPYKVSSVTITSTLSDSKSSYVSGYGNRTISLNEGNNNVQIKIKAENGEEATYNIKITREANDDATLKLIKINDKEITIEKDKFLYNEYVSNDIVKAKIIAEPNDSKAKVEIEKINELKEGVNQVNITVTSVKGNKNTYVINVIRDKLISENSKLKNITIANHKLDFNSNIYVYHIDITSKEDKLDIVVEPEHQKATYRIIGNNNLKNNSIIKIEVTAEDNETISTYELKINKKNDLNIITLIIPIIIIFCLIFIVYSIIKKSKNKNSKQINHDLLNPINNDSNSNNHQNSHTNTFINNNDDKNIQQ